MQDSIFIAATIAFLALSIEYVRFCDRVKGGDMHLESIIMPVNERRNGK
jgi:hypothetical protein